ncbi:MAG: Glycogen operon protein GlgX [Chlamydiia bacterium]|nr:Glycogen operon protein GlgX [Chlamydiia bacterium]MCH9615412.1 Glycogen operon protein GlgX [Chlamydiia bacterium]MCH9628266.1 Glycogen operon protein GlgX [Chlamydiia bacterium]
MTELIYEIHVKSLTYDATSKVKDPGTFSGVIQKIPYFLELGVTAIELMPVHPFDMSKNYWGYSSTNFLSLHQPYGNLEALKTLADALHAHSLQLIIDVVYNHTEGPLPDLDYFLEDFTGCGNTVSCNTPQSMKLILQSLQQLVDHGVDGFRFDLASVLTRDPDGGPMKDPPLIRAIETKFPNTLLIAEPWDVGGLYQVGSFPSSNFSEWNGQFRDHIRRFLKGDPNSAMPFFESMTGSKSLYEKNRLPKHSINFITAHDGFTLNDLVTYNEKHNEANGENNEDGSNANDSWNMGIEGPTNDPTIAFLRLKQMRNFITALLFSCGTPMLNMGDEYGHTRDGNNNPWCQDNHLNYFNWDTLKENSPWFSFVKTVINLRKQFPILNGDSYPNAIIHQITDHFIAYEIDNLFLAFNATDSAEHFPLPFPIKRLIDTHLDSPFEEVQLHEEYYLHPFSALIACY